MQYLITTLFSAMFVLLFLQSANAAVVVYDPLGRVMNPEEAFYINNPLAKGENKSPIPEIDQYDHLGNNRLHNAIYDNNKTEVEKLLKTEKAGPNICSAGGHSPLYLAVYMNNLEIAAILLKYGAKPDPTTPVTLANSEEMRALLRKAGAIEETKPKKNVNISFIHDSEALALQQAINAYKLDKQPITSLTKAVIMDFELEELSSMLDKGADINSEDNDFNLPTPLMQALYQRRSNEMISFLLEHNADPNLGSKFSLPIFEAIKTCNNEAIALLIDKGAKLNIKNYHGDIPLVKAAGCGPETIKILLEAGADPNQTDKDGNTALYYAIKSGGNAGMETAKLLLSKNPNLASLNNESPFHSLEWKNKNINFALLLLKYKVKPINKNGYGTLLHWAINDNSQELFEAALKANVSVTERDYDNRSPLLLAIEKQNAIFTEALLKAGAPVNSSVYPPLSDHPDDLLAIAVQEGNLEIIKILLRYQVNLNTPRNNYKNLTPLHTAVEQGRADIVNELLLAGAKPDFVIKRYGKTPLYTAVEYNNTEIVKSLLKARADVKIKYKDKITILHVAVKKSDTEIVKALLLAGANPNATDADRETPMHIAAYYNKPVLTDLLKAGGKVNIKDRDKNTPLHYAAQKGNLEAITVLLSSGADPTARNSKKKTPLDLAKGNNQQKAYEFMLNKHK